MREVKDVLYQYFHESFKVPVEDIQLEILHFNPEEIQLEKSEELRVTSRTALPRLGHQMLWLNIINQQLITKKVPVTLRASVSVPVAVATEKINRGAAVDADQYELRKVMLKDNINKYCCDQTFVSGMTAKRVIRPNTLIRKDMLEEAHDLEKGSEIQVNLVTGSLTVTTTGKAVQGGKIGSEIRIVCEPTGRRLRGIITSPETVLVDLN